MGIRKWRLLCLGLLLIATPALGADKINLPCEVLEASPAFESPSGLLNGVGYLLVHQANSADRERFSKWLKAHSGTEVRFIINQKKLMT